MTPRTIEEIGDERMRKAFWDDARKNFGGAIPYHVALKIAYTPIDDLIDWCFDNSRARCFPLDIGEGEEIMIFDLRNPPGSC